MSCTAVSSALNTFDADFITQPQLYYLQYKNKWLFLRWNSYTSTYDIVPYIKLPGSSEYTITQVTVMQSVQLHFTYISELDICKVSMTRFSE